MKRLLLILWIGLAIAAPVACTPPTTIVTQPGKIAFSADQVAVRVNEVQNAAIAANTSGALDAAQTKIIVAYAVSADKVLKATPAGWQAAVMKLWQEAAPKSRRRIRPCNSRLPPSRAFWGLCDDCVTRGLDTKRGDPRADVVAEKPSGGRADDR